MGCGKKLTKPELLRFVRQPDGSLLLDLYQREEGRGGYVCPQTSCFELATRKRRLSARFRGEVKADSSSLLTTVLDRAAREARSRPFTCGVSELAGMQGQSRSRPAAKAMEFYFEYISGGSSGWPK